MSDSHGDGAGDDGRPRLTPGGGGSAERPTVRRYVPFLVIGLSVVVAGVQATTFPTDATASLLNVVGEGSVVLVLAVALFVVRRVGDGDVYRPLMSGVALLFVFALTDFLDEFIDYPDLFGAVFENGAQAIGVVLLVVGIYRWTVARREREQELQHRGEQLEVLNRILRHDIRNDMLVVRGWASVMQRESGRSADERLDRIRTAADGVIDLTETTEEFAEVLTTTATVDLERRSLAPTVEREVEKIRVRYDEADVAVVGSLPDVDVVAHSMLPAVFRNLLTNAVEHNDAAVPTVRVSVERTDAVVRVRVADNGPGVHEERQEAIFRKHEAGTDGADSGFGLYLVRALVAEFGGDVWVEDADVGGAAFVVELRVASTGGLPDLDRLDAPGRR